ncbi:MAG: DUF3050 domain-containing protein [Brevundimonas sp.]|nr:DUF3050 domain-containing protein [Brevundimonas sp.]
MSNGALGMYELLSAIEPARRQLREHDLYASVNDLEGVRIFMEHHVFAVWDFMSLLKSLQQRVTCVSTPWLPSGSPMACRLVNAIVLEEESDDLGEHGCLSHFELYRRAMGEIGADCTAIDGFVSLIAEGVGLEDALDRARAPLAARTFVHSTFETIGAGEAHITAAAFTFGREDPIPGMFRRLLAPLEREGLETTRLLRLYLDRHIGLDEDHHTPMAVRMLADLCGEDQVRWRQASLAAQGALTARLALWSSVACSLALRRAGVDPRLAA